MPRHVVGGRGFGLVSNHRSVGQSGNREVDVRRGRSRRGEVAAGVEDECSGRQRSRLWSGEIGVGHGHGVVPGGVGVVVGGGGGFLGERQRHGVRDAERIDDVDRRREHPGGLARHAGRIQVQSHRERLARDGRLQRADRHRNVSDGLVGIDHPASVFRPALDALAGLRRQVVRIVHLKVAGPREVLRALAVLNDEEAVALNGAIEQSGGGLCGALAELAHREGRAGAEADLSGAQTGPDRLGDQVLKGNHAGLVTRGVQVGEVVRDHVNGGRVGVQRREGGRECREHASRSPGLNSWPQSRPGWSRPGCPGPSASGSTAQES